jgi:predicted Fe-Mo cluster-binding NifX family protein
MKIALPLHDSLAIYHDNAHTAPKFGIYNIDKESDDVHVTLSSIIDNPWSAMKCHNFEMEQLNCACNSERQHNLRHKCEHYTLLEMIHGCTFLLANKYCLNTKTMMKNGGITIFKIPPIAKKIDTAIKNFLIGASLANTIKHIHHES